jgi:hypothetical protein
MKKKKMPKKKNQKNAVAKTNFAVLFLSVFSFLTLPPVARSADFGAGLSSTSTGSIQKNYNLSLGITPTISVAIYAADSTQKSESTTDDNKANSYKGSLIYKPDSALRIATSYKKIDDYDHYQGVSYAAKLSVKSAPTPSRTKSWGTTKFSIGFQDDRMKYSKDEKETYEKLVLSLGLSQGLGDFFTVGVDYSKNAFLPKGANTILAFRKKTITDTNISDTVENLSDSSMGAYLEYNDLSFWSIGAGYSQSKNYLDKSDTSNSIDGYADIDIGENITVSPSYTTTKSKSSSTPKSNSVALNLGISF